MTSLRYIFHDCFVAVTGSARMVFDYWQDPLGEPDGVPEFLDGTDDDFPLYVFVSHHHKDHLNTDIFSWHLRFSNIRYIISKDVAKFCRRFLREDSRWNGPKVPPQLVTVMTPGDRFDDGIVSVQAFGSTDIGCSYLVRNSGDTFFHAGDLNAWIWKDESTPAEVKAAIHDFDVILNDIADVAPRIDYAMFPVDSRIGRDWFTGASMFVRRIDVARFFPMHFELADTPAELARRHADAMAFQLYANPERGEYISLLSPGAVYLQS